MDQSPAYTAAAVEEVEAEGVETAAGSACRSFLAASLVFFLVGLGACVALIGGTTLMGREANPYQLLVDYQKSKIRAGLPETIFVGDSSLGNAISAAEWERLTGQKAANLALIGPAGYAGSFATLKAALESGASIKTVVVFQAGNMMSRTVNAEAATLYDAPPNALAAASHWWRQNMNLVQLGAALTFIAGGDSFTDGPVGDLIQDDYVVQGPPLPKDRDYPPLQPSSIKPGKLLYLQKLADLCAEKGITCVYAHGPIAEPVCVASGAYFEKATSLIRATGIPIAAPRPPCIPVDEIGDSGDHVAPGTKAKYTAYYAELLRNHLGP